MSADPERAATVRLVGAGPGHPDLLTLDAEAAVTAAGAVLADRSLGPLLDQVAPGGPAGGPGRTVTLVDDHQPAVAEVLAAAAAGPGVVRLYLGDPWFHPAGDRERAALRDAGVPIDVIPGVSEELAALAAAGIPAQVRTLAVTTTFCADGPGAPAVPGGGLPADPAHALVVRTTDVAATVHRLVTDARERGLDLDRAAAVVPTGTGAGTGTGQGTAARAPVRAPLGALGPLAPGGRGVVVVGLVAALDTRCQDHRPTAPVDPHRVVGGRPLAAWLARPAGHR